MIKFHFLRTTPYNVSLVTYIVVVTLSSPEGSRAQPGSRDQTYSQAP
ncbi:MAG: hypothetical protein RIQ41_75 [Candidatus Parcubacteria bacterium]|jgi:hypothetical protein